MGPELIVPFLTLLVLEIILGIDNVVFISILAGRLPPEQRNKARIIGLSLALILRVILLFFATWIANLREPLFRLGPWEAFAFSGRDLVLILGGAFLLYKAVHEIHNKLEGEEGKSESGKTASFAAVLVQIVLIDAVFSLDSVITAVGVADNVFVMIAAVIIAIGLMMVFAAPIGNFVDAHPTVKMLALSFLILIGGSLIAEGFGLKVEKWAIYGPIAFAVGVEALNLIYKRRRSKESDVVKLRSAYSKDSDASDDAAVPKGQA